MDLSRLRERLRSMPTPSQKPVQKAAAGLIRREGEEAADARLYSLGETALRRIGGPAAFDIESALFLDTETTGLSSGVGTVAFLVGLGWVESGRMHTLQLLMRDYASEETLLGEVARAAEGFDCVVTFNGNLFDLPLLATRCTMNRRENPLEEMSSLDLLPPARRVWRRRLGSVRLANLEEKILGAGREEDLPGSEAPERFFSFLKTGDESLLEEVIDHNRQDILSMGALLAELCAVWEDPRSARAAADLYSLGRALAQQGEKDEARELYRLAGQPRPMTDLGALIDAKYRAEANMELAALLRREGRRDEQEEVLVRMRAAGEGGAFPLVELSKLYEHCRRDYDRAREAALQALAVAPEEEREALRARLDRIERKRKNKHREEK